MTSPHRTEAPQPPMLWTLIVRTTIYLKDGRQGSCVSVADTTTPATEPRPTNMHMSVINRIRRAVAQDNNVEPSAVALDWYDLVIGDEPWAR